MANFYRQVRDALIAGGCSFVRQGKGDHEVWFSPITKRNVILDRGVEIRHTANGTLKDAELPKLP